MDIVQILTWVQGICAVIATLGAVFILSAMGYELWDAMQDIAVVNGHPDPDRYR